MSQRILYKIMLAAQLFFYLFSAVVLFSACMVVFSRNPVHSVLFLILAFFNASGLFLLAGAEFLALILVIVYVGAVAVLFLFVVMMLNINFALLRTGMKRVLPVGLIVGGVFAVEMAFIIFHYAGAGNFMFVAQPVTPGSQVSNTHALGQVLYTDYIFLFQGVGMILLLAMVAAIVLTLRQREGVKKQDVSRQVGRKRKRAVRLVSVKPGEGV